MSVVRQVLLWVTPDRLVAVGRLALATFALAAAYIEPTEPEANAAAIDRILIAFVAYSAILCVVAFTRGPLGTGATLGVHAVDVATSAALIAFTNGATSPFFVFLTFAIFSGAVNWSWRGASATTLVTAGLYIVVSYLEAGPIHDVTRMLIRCLDLVVAGAFLSYLTAILDTANQRLRRLADWPRPKWDGGGKTFPPIEEGLGHTAAVLEVETASVSWVRNDEPYLGFATVEGGKVRFGTRSDPNLGIADSAHRNSVSARMSGRARQTDRSVRMVGANFEGWLTYSEGRSPSETLTLAEIAARQIGSEIDRHALQQQLLAAAAVKERENLAADIHDDLLQSLAAIALQLKTLECAVPPRVVAKLGSINNVIVSQQGRLRGLVARLREPPVAISTATVDRNELHRTLAALLASLEEQWSCKTRLSVEPTTAEIPEPLEADISFIVTEAVANAVKHGRATCVVIRAAATETDLSLVVEDDGAGLDRGAGLASGSHNRNRSGSLSLTRRVKRLGGSLELSACETGLRIEIHLPLAAREALNGNEHQI